MQGSKMILINIQNDPAYKWYLHSLVIVSGNVIFIANYDQEI